MYTKEQRKLYNKEYYEDNKERILEYKREWRQRKKEEEIQL